MRDRWLGPGILRGLPSCRCLLGAALLGAFHFGTSAPAAQAGDPIEYRAPNRPPVAMLGARADSADTGMIALPSDPQAVIPMTDAARPLYLAPYVDPFYGTVVTRITDLGGNLLPLAGAYTWGEDARHHYSKDQPWNSDGTLIAIQNSTSPDVVFLDGETYEVKFGECSNYSRDDDRWHPSPLYPHVRINAKKTELSWFDVVTCTKLRSWTLPFAVKHMGDGEGNPSNDGRFVALCDSARMFVVDMDPQPPFAPYPNQRIGPITNFDNCGLPECRLGWVSVSPSGKYVVSKYGGDHPRVYDLDPVTLAITPRPMAPGSPRCVGTAAEGWIYDLGHCDMTLNPFDNDEDVLIGQEHCGWSGTVVNGELMGNVVMARLSDGAVTTLTDPTNEAYPHHISTRNVGDPAWAYVGYYPDTLQRFADEIVAVKLDGSQAVRRFVQKHSNTSGDCYRCEAHAVPSWDGRRVMWASNWALHCTACGDSAEIKAYVVDARTAASEVSGAAPLTVTLDASRAYDPDGTAMSFRFDFGDGTVIGPQSARIAKHDYPPGEWTAIVTVTDEEGLTDTASVHVHVSDGSAGEINLVGNPSFETDLGGWNAYSGSTLSRVAGGLDGDWCLEIQGPASASTFGVNDSPGWVQNVPAAATRYRISAWVRSAAHHGGSRIRVREYLGGLQQGVTTYSPFVTLGPSWQQVTVEYVAVAAGSELDIQILDVPVATAEVFRVDQVAIVNITPPTTTMVDDSRMLRGLRAAVVPNPMGARAILALDHPAAGPLEISIYDLHGRRVGTLVDSPRVEAGHHSFSIDARPDGPGRLPEGVYFYRVRTAAGTAQGRFVVLE